MKTKLGFIKPNYPGERRVALLPEHIVDFENDIYIEKGFGALLDIDDEEYIKRGCTILERKQIFEQCNNIFSLKLVQKSDYPFLRKGHMIIGWTHPYGSGRTFFKTECQEKNIIIVDLDNITPRVFYKDEVIDLKHIPKNFIRKNSHIAGFAATMHALESYGLRPTSSTKVAILSPGNVAQGAFEAISLFGAEARMFYRKTMDEFYDAIHEFDIIINGIEVDSPGKYIISKEQLLKIKKNALIIDAAADAGNAIYGTDFTTFEKPLSDLFGKQYYCINNAPSIYFRTASYNISEAFSKYIYSNNCDVYRQLVIS